MGATKMILSPQEVAYGLQIYDVGAFLDRRTIRKNNPDGRGFRFKHHETNPEAELSPSYISLRMADNDGPLTWADVSQGSELLYRLADAGGLAYDHVVGIPNAGVPFSTAFQVILFQRTDRRLPLMWLGKAAKGGKRQIEGVFGDYKPSDRVLLVDDLITKRLTKLEAITALQDAGLVVDDLLLIVDREQGGIAELTRDFPSLRVQVLFTHTQLLDIYLEHGRITPELREEIVGYCERNQ